MRCCASVWMTESSSASRQSSTRLGSASPCVQKDRGALRQPCEAAPQFRRCLGGAERLDAKAASGEGVERDIDAVEIAVVRRAVLNVVDDLQRRADGVGRGPSAAALAVHVEHETPDRHRGVGAVAHEVVPVAVAQLGGVEPKGLEQILRMLRRHVALGKRAAQRDRLRIAVAGAKQILLQAVQQTDLLLRRKRGVVGDVVGASARIRRRRGSARDDAAG